MFCDEFHLVDLRVYENCKKVVKGCDHVFNLAADMGGELAPRVSPIQTAWLPVRVMFVADAP